MKKIFNKLALSTAIVGALAAMPMTASATNGILPYGNGMVSHGVGGAGVANASESMSAVDNPALAAKVGAGWSVQLSAFNPNRSADVGNGYVESDSNWFPIPGGSYFGRINDNVVAGVTVSALGGMNSDYPKELFGQRTGINLEGVLITPTIATKISDAVSIGVGIIYAYETMDSTGAIPTPTGQMFSIDGIEDSASGWGFEIGMAFDLGATTTLGIDYQSEINMDAMDKFAATLFASASDPALTLPATTTIGITQKIGDKWKIMADITDMPWSDIPLLKETFGWEDQTIYKIGAEMQVNDGLAFRFGYNYGASPVPSSAAGQNILAPAVTESHYTVGFSKNVGERGVIHGYYALVTENEVKQAGAPGGLPAIKMDQNAFGIGYEVKF